MDFFLLDSTFLLQKEGWADSPANSSRRGCLCQRWPVPDEDVSHRLNANITSLIVINKGATEVCATPSQPLRGIHRNSSPSNRRDEECFYFTCAFSPKCGSGKKGGGLPAFVCREKAAYRARLKVFNLCSDGVEGVEVSWVFMSLYDTSKRQLAVPVQAAH